MAPIDSLDKLIAEFEKVAPTIEQLLQLAEEAAELKEKLAAAHADVTTKLAEIENVQQRLNHSLKDFGPLEQSLKSRIDATKTLETNVSKALIGLKNDLTDKVDSVVSKLDADKQSAMSTFQASVDKAIISLPSRFDQLKEQLSQAMHTHVANELQEFLARQNTLVVNVNQRIDVLENLARTQQEAVKAQLHEAMTRLQRLEEAFEKKGNGFLSFFR